MPDEKNPTGFFQLNSSQKPHSNPKDHAGCSKDTKENKGGEHKK